MKKFLSKFFVIALSFLMVLSNFNLVQAKTKTENYKNKGRIISKKVSQNLIDYANKQFEKHLLTVSRNSEEFGFKDGDVDKLILGHPFSVYENKGGKLEGNQIYYFPVVGNNEIKAVLGVAFVNGEYYSTFQKAFADEIENLIKNKESAYRIVTDENELKAISFNDEVIISNKNRIQNEKNNIKLKRSPADNMLKNNKTSSDEIILDEDDLKTPVNEVILNGQDLKTPVKQPKNTKYIPDGPYEYNSIPMDIVTQGSHPWCWAATCAGIINYVKGENLIASDVVKFIYGSAVEKGGSWSEMKRAYNHWGLKPYETGTLPYWQVKNSIDAMKPIHLGLNQGESRHSVTLKGYEKYRDGNNIYVLIDPNYTNTVSMDIKEDRNSMYYVLDGQLYFWNYSRLGF